MRARIYILEKNIGDDKIILSTDEIANVSLKTIPCDKANANVASEVFIEIEGKILSNMEGGFLESLTDSIKRLISNPFDANPWSNKHDVALKTKALIQQKYGHVDLNSVSMGDIYRANQENIGGLKKWAFSYNDKSDYRDVVIEFIYNNTETALYFLPDVYAIAYEEDYSITNGNGGFTIKLKQKLSREGENEFIQS